MSDIDEKIRKALSEEDQKLLDEIDDEAGLFDMMAMTFKGKMAWITWYMYIVGIAVFIAGLYFLNQFFEAEELKESLGWLLAIITCLTFFIIIKIIGWQQLLRAEIMREMKRLEMRVMLALEQPKDG
ncbi:MAG: hypothetical protein GKR91_11910 [Pseudomonadales bacterium]|nr:hypothetical protein [Pseudomonadales bacterium]